MRTFLRRLLFSVFLILISLSFLKSQTTTFTATNVTLRASEQAIIDQTFGTSAITVSLPVGAINSHVKNSSTNITFDLVVPQLGTIGFNIEEKEIRSNNFKMKTSSGITKINDGVVNTYQGYLNGNSTHETFAYISNSIIAFHLKLSSDIWTVKKYTGFSSYTNLYIFYPAGLACNPNPTVSCTGSGPAGDECNTVNFVSPTTTRYLELAIEGDYEFFLTNNSDTEIANSILMMVCMEVAKVYLDYFDLEIILVDEYIFDQDDPYEVTCGLTTCGNDALDEFQEFWRDDDERKCIQRDAVIVITGRDLPGCGKAWEPTSIIPDLLCTQSPFDGEVFYHYAYAEYDENTASLSLAKTVAHELAHIIGLGLEAGDPNDICASCCADENSSSVMCACAGACFLQFSKQEQELIWPDIQNAACLLNNPNGPNACEPTCRVTVNFSADKTDSLDPGCFDDQSTVTYTAEICNDCTPRQLSVRFVSPGNTANPNAPDFQNIISFPNGFSDQPSPTGTSRWYIKENINFSANECQTLIFTADVLSRELFKPNLEVFTPEYNLQNNVNINGQFGEEICQIDGSSNTVKLSDLLGTNFNCFGIGNTQNNTYIIDGTFEIDVTNWTFEQAAIEMGPDAEIIVKSGSNLSITDSRVYGCASMWKSITVEPNASLYIDTSIIEDGIHAIHLQNDAILTLNGNTFNDNYIGLYIPGDGSLGNVEINGLYGNSFIDDSNSTMLPPYANKIGFAGIYAEDQNALDLSAYNPIVHNLFDGLANGIVLENCAAVVNNNRYYNILTNNTLGYDFTGRAISHVGPSGNSFDVSATLVHETYDTAPDFENCSIGVYVNQASLRSRRHHMRNVEHGYVGLFAGMLDIKDNLLEGISKVGIAHFIPRVGDVDIVDNEIYVNDPTPGSSPINFGIYIVAANGASDYLIENNFVFVENAKYGVYLTGGSEVKVLNNTVELSDTYTPTGMRIAGGVQPFVQCNVIESYSNNRTKAGVVGIYAEGLGSSNISCNNFYDTHDGLQFLGINPNTDFRGNIFHKHTNALSLGKEMTGSSDLTAVIGTQIQQGNLWLDNALNSGFQALFVNPNQVAVNLSSFEVDENEDDDFFADNNTISLGLNWFDDQSTPETTYNCTTENSCPNGFGFTNIRDPKTDHDSYATGVTLDPIFKDGYRWSSQYDLFRGLESGKIATQGQSSTVLNFQTQQQTDTIGLLYAIEEDIEGLFTSYASSANYWNDLNDLNNYLLELANLDSLLIADPTNAASYQSQRVTKISSIDNVITQLDNHANSTNTTASSSLSTIKADNNTIATGNWVPATNQKEVNEVWIDVLRTGQNILTTNQITELTSIAQQCPLAGGPAVHTARSLLALDQAYTDYDDYNNCTTGGSPLQQGINTLGFVRDITIYPNPAKEEIQVALRTVNDKPLNWTIQNIVGQTVLNGTIGADTKIQSINLTSLNTGTYVLIIEGEGYSRKSIKFVKD